MATDIEASHKLATVPETVLKKRKRDEQWAATRRDMMQRLNKRGKKKETFVRAEKLIKEFRKRVSNPFPPHFSVPWWLQDDMRLTS